MGTPSAEHDDSMPSQGTGKLRRARGNTAQIGALLRNGIIEISPDPPAEQHTPGPDCDDAEGVPLGRAPSAALKRQRSPELGSNMPMSPSLFPLERAQILTTVAKAIALHIRHDPSFSAPDELAIFDQASVEGPAFDGSEDEIRQLLEAMVNLGLDPNVRGALAAASARLRGARAPVMLRATPPPHRRFPARVLPDAMARTGAGRRKRVHRAPSPVARLEGRAARRANHPAVRRARHHPHDGASRLKVQL